MAYSSSTGWLWARDEPRKLHSDTQSYAELRERENGKDRNTFRHYPDFAARAGFRFVPIE
jgi:hypothetical protein